MSDREAMQQALEALEAVGHEFVCRATHHKKKDQHRGFDACPNAERHQQAITALKAALEQPEQEPYAEQSRRVWQETQGRMRICPVTGGVGIGTPPPQQQAEPKNEFNPDWDQMAVLVEQSQEQAAKIEQLEKQLAERSAEYLAAHITYDNGYEAGRQAEPVETYVHEYRSQPHPNDFGIPKGHWWKAKQYADALYTNPPQRKPLTTEDRSSIVNEALRGHASTRDAIDWAIRHVERHHGIKGEP